MRLQIIFKELLRLFVDDGRFAACIVLWIAALHFALPYLGIRPWSQALILVTGLFVILFGNTLHYRRPS